MTRMDGNRYSRHREVDRTRPPFETGRMNSLNRVSTRASAHTTSIFLTANIDVMIIELGVHQIIRPTMFVEGASRII
jgi:hypothetical protein